MVYDAIIVGAGVVGALAARKLAQYELKVLVLEKEHDVAMGASMANSAIVHAGFDPKPGSLKALLNVQGNAMMDRLADELCVPFRRAGAMVICFNDNEKDDLQKLYERGLENNVPSMRIISGDEARQLEPRLSGEIVAALVADSSALVCPYELTIAACENAADNGVEFKMNAPVTGIHYNAGVFGVETPSATYQTKYIVNAAGVFADKISEMIGDNSVSIKVRRGEYMLLDKSASKDITRTMFQLPTKFGKGILINPTVDNNLIIGPTAEESEEKENTETTPEGLAKIVEHCRRVVPDLSMRDVITSFTGLRATLSPAGDFIVDPSPVNKNFIQAAGIESPGLSAAPAIAVRIADKLAESGLTLKVKEDFNPRRRPVKRFSHMNEAQLTAAHAENPLFANIVCRCEMVSEAEIVDSIRRNVGATSVDGVKRRTRAGMGRCQGGFCSPKVVEILSRELGIPTDKVTKKGGDSWILTGKVK